MIRKDIAFIRMREKEFDSIRPIFEKSLFDSIRFVNKKFNSVRFDSAGTSRIESNYSRIRFGFGL
jgi:hypothetical protein